MEKLITIALAAVIGLAATPTVGNAAPIQLALILDGSGSIGASNFNSMKVGIISGLNAHIPLDGSVELTVVKFGNTAHTVVAPTLITSAADLAMVTSAIANTNYLAEWTNTAAGIHLATQLVTGSSLFATAGRQVFNIVTDGLPNVGSPNGQQASYAAADAALAAGIDELSAEGVGLGPTGQNFLLNLVFPGNGYLGPPLNGPGFVYPVIDFEEAFAEAFAQKLQFVVFASQSSPEPGTMAVLGIGALVGAAFYRRSRLAA